MRGRKPLPTAIKELRDGKVDKLETGFAGPEKPRRPNCPVHLKGDARKEWNRISVELFAMGLLARADTAALGLYCQLYARAMECSRIIERDGCIVKTGNGYPIQSPHLNVWNATVDRMMRLLVEFGMTPSSRTRIHVEAPKSGGKSENEEKYGLA